MAIKKKVPNVNMKLSSFRLFAASLSLAIMATPMTSEACSRLSWNTDQGVFAARTMDWAHSFNDLMFIFPRGQTMTGGDVQDALKWTSKYGSIITSIYPYAKKYGYDINDGATDGINEKGLSAHLLYLEKTQYSQPNAQPSVSYLRWVRYILDNFATVDEAVNAMKNVRIDGVKLGKSVIGTHLVIEDISGDNAIFEVLDGELKVHHGKQYNVMTNDPPYDWQIINLSQYTGFGGFKSMPGSIEPADRFVRASYYTKNLPEPTNSTEAVGYAMSAIRSVVVPFGAPTGQSGASTYPTWWTSATDLEQGIYYFNWSMNPNVFWLDTKEIDFSNASGVRFIDPKNPSLNGNVTKLIRAYNP